MGKSFRSLRLTAAIGVALAGAGLASAGLAYAGNHEIAATEATQSNPTESYIIRFTEQGLLTYRGNVAGLASTAPDRARGDKLDRNTPAARAYEAWLSSQRMQHRATIEGTLGRALDVTHSYGITFNGIAADLSADEAAEIANLPGVESVEPAGVYHLDTYRGPTFIGADQVWDGSSTPTGIGTRGEGVVVGIIDGGANLTHPSFANDASCGFGPDNPKLIAVDCSTSSGGICNGSDPSANPGFGHGVHTASTAAGNVIDNTDSPAPNLPDDVTMSGVAPCAQIHQYKVCATNSCNGAAIAAGIQNAIADGVDVINFSISGGTSPWTDNDRSFLSAVDAGVFVAASAGNNTPTDPTVVGRVNHRGPWVMTVAASSHDATLGPSLSLTGPGTPPAVTQSVSLTPGSTTPVSSIPNWTDKPIKTYPSNIEGCTEMGGITAGAFTDSIAVLRRGTCNFSEKIENAYNAGAIMVVIANNVPEPISMDTTGAPNVPSFSLNNPATGDAIITFLTDNPTSATADVAPLAINLDQGDVLASFSYRGPTPNPLADLTKPDITGPGVNIYAASDVAVGNYEVMSGTSMSSPHVAGAGALVKAVHNDWTPIEIRSALMTTAKADGFKEDGIAPWNVDDVGSGRVNVADAVRAGLTMNETTANFLAANPSGGSLNVKQLNVPSMRNMDCTPGCTWTRTFKNRLATTGNWTISADTGASFTVTASPANFSLAPDAEQTVTFTAMPIDAITTPAFGYVTLSEDGDQSPAQHLTVAIKGVGGPTYQVGGEVSGLHSTGLSLQLNGGSDINIDNDGPFEFLNPVLDGQSYSVTVATQPMGQTCSVSHGTGIINGADVDDVEVTCVDLQYTVGGRVTGLKGPGLKLELNGDESMTMMANGLFRFQSQLDNGTSYSVLVINQPTTDPQQTCTVANGNGTIDFQDVDDVVVTCAVAPDDVIFADGFDGAQ